MMKLNKFIKEQIDTVNDEFLLEAADKDLDSVADSRIYYTQRKDTIMERIKKIASTAACIALAAAAVTTFLYIQGSITDPGGNTDLADSGINTDTDSTYDTDTDTTDTVETENVPESEDVITLFDLELTEDEIAFIEDVTEKDFETLTAEDLAAHKNIAIVGNHALWGDYKPHSGTATGYIIDDITYEIGPDYAEYVHLLKYFPELTGVHIYYNPTLTDVSFLADIPKLESLTLELTNVEDLSVLKSHSNLKIIDVGYTPVSKLELHPDVSLKEANFYAIAFGDLSVFEGQTQMTSLQFYYNAVPITNTEILKNFHALHLITLVAPECDYSFFEDMKIKIPNVHIGGRDNIDLSPLSKMMPGIGHFWLFESNGGDLTLLDSMEEDSSVTLNDCEPAVRGERTSESSEYLKVQDSSIDKINRYYNDYLGREFPASY